MKLFYYLLFSQLFMILSHNTLKNLKKKYKSASDKTLLSESVL